MITQELLKTRFSYSKEEGLVYRQNIRGAWMPGKKAGTNVKNSYTVIFVAGKRYWMHNLVWFWHYGMFPEQIDHINHDKYDNRIENLRDAGHQENMRNLSLYKRNRSGVSGVCYKKNRNMWEAYINDSGKRIHLGSFSTKEAAIERRAIANKEYGYHPNHGKMWTGREKVTVKPKGKKKSPVYLET